MFNLQSDRKDLQSNGCITGFEVLLQKQLKGKQMQKEMAEFVRERCVLVSLVCFFFAEIILRLPWKPLLSFKQTISPFLLLIRLLYHNTETASVA